ncbi:hypothetical protein IQ251_00980 [Saccharopolyspora sp. HNM0983]|uniref:Uncharacterized protein n=1 Tax=Saccharopolyspora montiporae TaxID=2781240 RepID=A0A929FW02_9PSEU|nr:hypothetical protein [Saccharopolyspora sp. HNM0983]MBE9373011.1 hypothetical protein [Saccharopolyspora sp. HNM0983]
MLAGSRPEGPWRYGIREAARIVGVSIAVLGLISIGPFLVEGPPWSAPNTGVRVGFWLLWPVLLLQFLTYAYGNRLSPCSAGAEWLRGADGRWVRTYELTRITARRNAALALVLEFHDRRRRTLEISVDSLRNNPRVWDLVHNGVLHSVVANKALTNTRLHTSLQLPYPEQP